MFGVLMLIKTIGNNRLKHFKEAGITSLDQINEENKIKDFGYYTNGYPLEKITKIEIQGDTILIDQIFSSY